MSVLPQNDTVFAKMLIAVDGSPCSEHAAKRGIALASSLQIPVALFCVIDRSQEIIPTDLEVRPIQRGSFLEDQAKNNIQQIMEKYVPRSIQGQVQQILTEGLPREEILRKLDDWQADILVVGTHGRKGIAHFLLGSTAEYLVRHAKIPVMVVPYDGPDF